MERWDKVKKGSSDTREIKELTNELEPTHAELEQPKNDTLKEAKE